MVYDIAIVGFGPVGATMANLLGRTGCSVAIIERDAHIFDKPRAIGFDHEVMRVFQGCGLADAILPCTGPSPGLDFVGIDGGLIKAQRPMPPPFPMGWQPNYTFLQPELDTALRAGVARYEGVQVLLRHELTGLRDDGDLVRLAATDLAHGTSREFAARFLLACDGANSFVRRHLGLGQDDLGFDELWLVVDALLKRAAPLPERSVQYCWPSRPATFILGPRNLRRWEIKLLPGERAEEFAGEAAIRAQLARFADPDALELWRAAVYRFHALVASRWRQGRVFLAGDAAHQMPPFFGQGLCSGIRDAANLAWKLDHVLHRGAPPSLLDSYEAERKPHVRDMVALAKSLGLIIGELDHAAGLRRDAELRRQRASGEVEIRQRLIPGLVAGIIADGAPAGALSVQPRIMRDGGASSLLDDIVGPRFLFAARPEARDWLDDDGAALWRRLGGASAVIAPPGGKPAPDALVESDGIFDAWTHAHRCGAVIVRPDGYVFGAARDAGEARRLARAVGRHILGP